MTDKAFLENVSEVAFKRFREAGYHMKDVEEPYQKVVIIYSAQGVIDNGGLPYFFERDWANHPPYSDFADAYERIGRKDAARVLREAAASFGVPNPERNLKAREEYMKAHQGRFNGMVWDDRICGDTQVFVDLANWVRAHPDFKP